MQRVVTNASELCEIGIEVIMRKDDDMYQGDGLMMIEKNERGVRKRRMDMRTGCVDDDRKERKRGQKTKNGYEDWLCLQYYYWLCL